VGQPRIRIALENGPEVSPADGRAVGRVIVRNRQTLFDLILDPEVGFGEAYSDGRITVEGDLAATLEETERSLSGLDAKSWYSRLVSRCLAYAQRNSVRGARVNIHRHYDLDNNFFRLWLDPQLVYSCAYFPAASMSLEEAQVAKMDYVSRKLNLQPEERVVDVGSGWGALALHMAEHYGVSVRGFSISHEQVVWSRRRAKELGLDHRVEFIEDDYRNISGKCDAIVSVGMLEHVGAENYGEMGRVIDRTLGACGRGLMHSIGRNQPKSFNNWTSENIFPGAYAPTLRQMMNLFEPWQFSILDVENLRPHYARTLQFWLKRFEDAARAVCDKFGPEFVNTWRLYLAGAVAGFRAGTLQLFQIIFARKAYRGIPATRAHLYREELRKGQIASPFLSDGSSSQPPVRPSQLPEPVAPLVESTH
jgi:cyclopropane-fatty-acyl-phospholipid synthase